MKTAFVFPAFADTTHGQDEGGDGKSEDY